MTLWLDAQLPPLLAAWINAQNWGIQAVAVREIGLRDASVPLIFRAARAAGAVVMTKERDCIPQAGGAGATPAGDLAAPGQRQQRRAAGGVTRQSIIKVWLAERLDRRRDPADAPVSEALPT